MTAMKAKFITFAMGLGLVLFVFSSCVRQDARDNEPSPTGPSTIYLTLYLSASPNVLYATTNRPTSEIKAVVKEGTIPLSGATIYFTLGGGPGYFSDYSRRTAIVTDGGGVATITYVGPTKDEIANDQDAMIQAHLQTSSPNYMHKEVYLRILRAED
jgi:hypothetical protein